MSDVHDRIAAYELEVAELVALDTDRFREAHLLMLLAEIAKPVAMGERVDPDALERIAGAACAWAVQANNEGTEDEHQRSTGR